MVNVPIRIAIAASLLSLVSAAYAERKVYKCTDGNGTVVFSSQPCGADAKEIAVDPGSSKVPATTTSGSPDHALRDIGDSVADSTCRREAEHAGSVDSEDHLND